MNTTMNALIHVENLSLLGAGNPLIVLATVAIDQPRGRKTYRVTLSHDDREPSYRSDTWRVGSIPRRYRRRVQGCVFDAVDNALCMMGGWRQ